MKSNHKAPSPIPRRECSRATRKTLVNFTSEGGTSGWKEIFLRALATTPSVKSACAAARVSRMTAYRYRATDAEFAEHWQNAIRHSVDDLEAVAFKLAAEGNAGLIQFLLRCHRPEIYKDTQRHEVGLLGGIVLLPPKEEGSE